MPAGLAVAFVDLEGECVDYCSAVDPFDAKVAAAQLLVKDGFSTDGLTKHVRLVVRLERAVERRLRDGDGAALEANTATGAETNPAGVRLSIS